MNTLWLKLGAVTLGFLAGCILLPDVSVYLNWNSRIFTNSKLPSHQDDIGNQLLKIKSNKKFKQPNILIFLADDLGWNDVGYHGSIIKTPTIDRLAEEGVKLENYYVQPICTPSRSQLFSGRYQIHTGLQHMFILNKQPLGLTLNSTILPKKLRQVGYKNYLVGKWHLGYYKNEYLPQNRGFDRFFGIYPGSADHYNYKIDGGAHSLVEDGLKFDANRTYSTHMYTQKTIEYLHDHLNETAEKPFLMVVSYQAIHIPYQVPDKYLEPYQDVNPPEIPERKNVAAMTACMDESMKEITDFFKENGLWNNTLTIFTTDNGGYHRGSSNYPLREGKQALYEGGVRGVGFVTGPLLEKTGRTSHELLHISDIYPTIVKLAGGDISDQHLDGFDVWDTISKGVASPRQEILLNIDPLCTGWGESMFPEIYDTSTRSAIRMGDWKLITGYGGRMREFMSRPRPIDPKLGKIRNVELYNIRKDPEEANDLFYKEPEKVKELLLNLAAYNRTAVAVDFPPVDSNWRYDAGPGESLGPWM